MRTLQRLVLSFVPPLCAQLILTVVKQVFPSGHRGTGNGVAIGLNRIMGIVSAVVGHAANVSIRNAYPRSVAGLKKAILTIHPDQYASPHLHLCGAVYRDGGCGRSFAI